MTDFKLKVVKIVFGFTVCLWDALKMGTAPYSDWTLL